jgi:ATP-dependent DNA ligase
VRAADRLSAVARMHTPREGLRRFIEPMLLGTGLPAGAAEAWALELKWGGLRAQLRVDGQTGWCLRSRPGRDCTAEFPELAEPVRALRAHRAVLDGELVHLGVAASRTSLRSAGDWSAAARMRARGRQQRSSSSTCCISTAGRYAPCPMRAAVNCCTNCSLTGRGGGCRARWTGRLRRC